MGIQLIFVVETNKKCNSDWIYIKDTIEYFYDYNRTEVKFSPVYMDGRGKYKNKEKQVKQFIKEYSSMSKTNCSKVVYCFDCDNYDSDPNDLAFLKEVKKYCEEKAYEFVWFCKDIEQVYIGKRVEDSKKKKEAATFKAKKMIQKVDKNRLSVDIYKVGASNIMNVLDTTEELIRKS